MYLKLAVRSSFRLPLLGSFLFQSAEGGHVPHPITHPRCSSLYLFLFQFIFPEHGSAEFELVLQIGILGVQLTPCQFLLEILPGKRGSYLHFHGCAAFEPRAVSWLAQALCLTSAHLLTGDFFPVAWPQGAKTLSDLGEQPSNS